MHEPNVARVLGLIGPDDVVLDIGGWARPFNRADYVMDAEPYETRGYYGTPQGEDQERFTSDTWIQRDICEHTPYPFRDKELDYVICSHTLEDVRDPLWVCAEMTRIAKRGYIEVPSRVAESCRGTEPGQVGWSHHRWLIDIDDGRITFLMKYHMIHSHWRFSLPVQYLRRLDKVQCVQWLFWEDRFEFHERTIHGVGNIARELEQFVERTRPYARWRLAADRGWRAARDLGARAVGKLGRTLRGARPTGP
jgi:hypothetical protein